MLMAQWEKVSTLYASHPEADACVAFSGPGEAPARLVASRRAETQNPKQGRQQTTSWVLLLLYHGRVCLIAPRIPPGHIRSV